MPDYDSKTPKLQLNWDDRVYRFRWYDIEYHPKNKETIYLRDFARRMQGKPDAVLVLTRADNRAKGDAGLRAGYPHFTITADGIVTQWGPVCAVQADARILKVFPHIPPRTVIIEIPSGSQTALASERLYWLLFGLHDAGIRCEANRNLLFSSNARNSLPHGFPLEYVPHADNGNENEKNTKPDDQGDGHGLTHRTPPQAQAEPSASEPPVPERSSDASSVQPATDSPSGYSAGLLRSAEQSREIRRRGRPPKARQE